jgi:hypothetical protein
LATPADDNSNNATPQQVKIFMGPLLKRELFLGGEHEHSAVDHAQFRQLTCASESTPDAVLRGARQNLLT